MSLADEGREIVWTQPNVAGVPVGRLIGHVGAVEVGAIEFDPSNRLWLWSSPLVEDAWGWAPTEMGAKGAASVWLRQWLGNFQTFLSREV
jgi:hypothetical protein